MKKIKFKRKQKRIFFSTSFIAFLLIMIILTTSSAYALLKEKLHINGTVSGKLIYTYYFEKPDSWDGSNMYAHIWEANLATRHNLAWNENATCYRVYL